jgi:hypothetical protein
MMRDLDVHALNKTLRVLGAERMRHAMFPDAAYGMVFLWYCTVVRIYPLFLALLQNLIPD